VAVLIADTGYELYAACETVRDLDQLYLDLGMADEVQEDAMHSACNALPLQFRNNLRVPVYHGNYRLRLVPQIN
jgi:hypothetical protein